jgi:hypothetical protein
MLFFGIAGILLRAIDASAAFLVVGADYAKGQGSRSEAAGSDKVIIKDQEIKMGGILCSL